MKYYLAIDLGASSGRHIVGYKNENNELILEEMYRFKNENKTVDGHLTWDIDSIFQNIKDGIKVTLAKYPNIESMSIDTWGVDYVLMDNDKEIYPCYAYRDSRTKEPIEKCHEIIPFERLYEISGCQFQEFTTIYQLYSDKLSHRLDKATDYLMIPCYFMYKLTGKKFKEYTNEGNTGLIDVKTMKYSDEIISKLGLPEWIKKDYSKPGTLVGDFTKEVQDEVGGNIKVVLCATHDTASAVEGIPMEERVPYISSGTWSLFGIKNDYAINDKTAYKANYSNEFGPDYFRVQKNIMGLWITQCVAKELDVDFVTMAEEADKSSYDLIFDANDNRFLSPKNMKDEILAYFKDHNMAEPKTNGDIYRTIYRSLATSYKNAIEELEAITNKKYNDIYIVGGGAKNKFLNKTTKEITEREIHALPIEATSIGNILVQMKR